MNNFVVHMPTKLFFGKENATNFFSYLKDKSQTILLVTGGSSAKKLGYLDQTLAQLKEAGIEVLQFTGIEPNPLSTTINRAASEYRKQKIDAVLALGGGSVMDASKAIGSLLYMYQNGDTSDLDIWDYVLGSKKHTTLPGSLPIFAIPTTAATASEVTPFSVISNLEKKGKAPLAYEFHKPVASLLLPEFTTMLSNTVTRDGASDIMSHVFENYLLGGSEASFTDKYCEAIIKTVVETLPLLTADPLNVKLRGELMWCSTMALNGIQLAGRTPAPFVLHAIEHALSAVKHDLAHGRGLATLYPAYFRWLWNNDRSQDKLAKLGQEVFKLNPKDGLVGLRFIEQFEIWLKENELLQSISSLGFAKEEKEYVADYVIKTYGAGKPLDALGPLTKENILEILELTETQK